HLEIDDALAAATLLAVLVDRGAFAVAARRDAEDVSAAGERRHAHHLIAALEPDAAHAVGRTAHRAHVSLGEADGEALARRQQDLALAVGDAHVEQAVVLLDPDRDDAAGHRVGEGGELGL